MLLQSYFNDQNVSDHNSHMNQIDIHSEVVHSGGVIFS